MGFCGLIKCHLCVLVLIVPGRVLVQQISVVLHRYFKLVLSVFLILFISSPWSAGRIRNGMSDDEAARVLPSPVCSWAGGWPAVFILADDML